jgi:hypothetical protein
MKTKLHLLILLLALFKAAVAQTGPKCREEKQFVRTRILSREEMTVTGSFQFTLEVLAYDTCTLDSIRIINDGTFFNISFNGSLSKSQNISQPSFTLKNLFAAPAMSLLFGISGKMFDQLVERNTAHSLAFCE